MVGGGLQVTYLVTDNVSKNVSTQIVLKFAPLTASYEGENFLAINPRRMY